MKAIVLDPENRTTTLSTLPIPTPGPNELLIAVKAIAINDVNATSSSHPYGDKSSAIASELAGLVIARGPPSSTSSSQDHSATSPSHLRRSSTALSNIISRGDRVAGYLWATRGVNCTTSDDELGGAFAEYVVCSADQVWRVPPHVSLEDAASVGLCAYTAAQALYLDLGLPAPFHWDDDSEEGVLRRVESETSRDGNDASGTGEEDDEGSEITLLVVGASTSVGMYAAQLFRSSAEVSGRRARLIGLASPESWDMLRADPYGFDVLVDIQDTSWPEQVGRAVGDGVDLALHAAPEDINIAHVSGTLRQGGKLAVTRSVANEKMEDEGVALEPVHESGGKRMGTNYSEPVGCTAGLSPVKTEFMTAFYKWLSDGGLLRPLPVRIMLGGLDRMLENWPTSPGTSSGMGQRENGRQSGLLKQSPLEKLVYSIDGGRRGSVGAGGVYPD